MDRNLYVKGFPQASKSAFVRPVFVDDFRKTLASGVIDDGEALNRLRVRGSPDVNLRVVTLSGPVQAGDSGAPIFDRTGAVAALASGGLLRVKDIAWGVPLEDLHYTNYDDARAQLEKLSSDTGPSLFAFTPSPVRVAALRPAISASLAMSTDNPEGELGLTLPFRLGNERVAATFEGGVLQRQINHSIDTLPGVPSTNFSTDLQHGYFQIGVTYHPTRLPKTTFDPYVRGGAGLIDANRKYPLETIGGGIDLLVGGRTTAFVEADLRHEILQDSTLSFNQYGEAGVVSLRSSSLRGRVVVGLRFSLNVWPIQ